MIWVHMLSLGKFLEGEDGGWGRMKRREGREKKGRGKEFSARMPGSLMLEAKVEGAGHRLSHPRGPGGDSP